LNILFIISSLKHGGAEKQTIIDANLFSEKNNVTLIAFKDGELKSLLNKRVHLIFVDKKGYLNTSKIINKIIKENNIQVINASLFASMIIAVLSAKKNGIPVIWYFHSHEYDLQLKSKIALKYFSKKNCLKKILFVSNELRKTFYDKGFNFPENKQDILYNTYTVSLKNYKKIANSEREVKIGYIGRLVDLKRVDYLIETADYLIKNNIMNFCINIIGDGELKNKLMKYAEKLNILSNINFLGFQTDVEKYYEDFDIFSLPSGEECLSIALIDACIKSVPSVAFNVGGNNEIIVNGETGYLVNSKEEFFEKLRILINDEKMRKEMGANASRYCIEKFNAKKRFNLLENIFQNLN
jgi:glycosyltransferase involved in cell wall biosynthesis